MTAYTGTFHVINNTGQAITNVHVKHTASGQTATEIDASALAVGAATGSQTYYTQSGSNDDWDVSFQLPGGDTKTRDGKQCNVPNADGLACVITLNANDFSIVTPDTSPCLNNHY